MTGTKRQMMVFGEVLFDCFPTGEEVLGGAPFNVAWHLQALGDDPCFISRVGNDALGSRILAAMRRWGMRVEAVQIDPGLPTGRVQVKMTDGQPSYRITENVAYDAVRTDELPTPTSDCILYHGTLALRQTASRQALDTLAQRPGCDLFIDVNLRAPWWTQEDVYHWLSRARWAKMNEDELRDLGFSASTPEAAMVQLLSRFELEQLIVTRGAAGALVRTRSGDRHSVPAIPIARQVDSVGAGDAFSAVYLHGLLAGWSIPESVERAQRLAAIIIGQRGAIPADRSLYHDFTTTG